MRNWLFLLVFIGLRANSQTLVVDAAGHGDFTTVQAAINSLPDSAPVPRRIVIRNGIYHEKLFIEKNNLILEGEDRAKTILTFAIARDAWRCDHKDDWGVATLNLKGSDITLLNLSIVNSYGFDNKAASMAVPCGVDSVKVVGRQGHQMALRSLGTTRLKVINCTLRAFGGDTVSPWNVTAGMFYFKDCFMEGGVDFYCPRGWAYAEHCTFLTDNGPACIWHDGSVDPDSKTVLKDCTFTGYDGFKLGRYHRDAQFYLIDCHFAGNMADTDIYLVPTPLAPRWGHRVYYAGCDKKGRAYTWYADNLDKAPGAPHPQDITPDWVFHNQWKPADTTGNDKTVLLDYYFNNERHKDATGASVRYHYTWEDTANSGFSTWGQLFRMNGAHTDSLPTAPTASTLKKASVYIIVDPDDDREVPSPNYPDEHDITAIANWVEAGGVLVLMSNDSANCEFPHFNRLAARFGIHFNFDDYHKVAGNNYEMGAFLLPDNDTIFRTTKKIFIKELSTLQLSGAAHPVYTDSGHVIMAVARIGKGTVFAVGDPWFYNEYINGRKLPADFENYNAARDLAQWLLTKAKN